MAFKVNTNIDALNAYFALKNTTNKTIKAQTAISTGLRINHVWDDTSGFNIGKALDVKARIMESVQGNIGSAKDMLSTAEAALLKIKDHLTTIETKVVDASNPVSKKEAIAKDIRSLALELAQIFKNTKFNETSLLIGTAAAATSLQSPGAFGFQVSDDLTDQRLHLDFAVGLSSHTAYSFGTTTGALLTDNYFLSSDIAAALDSMIIVGQDGMTEVEYSTMIASLSLASFADVDKSAITRIKEQVDTALQKIGNFAQRLEAKEEFFDVAVANAKSNYSRLFDADFAMEQLRVTRGQIMQQAGIAMLAQLSAQPQQVLALFQ